MHLPPDQAERFYHIWMPLLHYVNTRRNVVPEFPATHEPGQVSPDQVILLRDVLWADDALRESFVAENPAGLSSADLALVSSWQHRLKGEFFIFRHLKKYTVFLSSGEPARAYGVLGIVSPLEDIVGPYLPIYVQAVLLPWEGEIIYDSLLAPYPVSFGSGIRADLNDTYRNIQEREGIITTLLPTAADVAQARKDIAARNTKVLNAFRKNLARGGLSAKMLEQHAGNIAGFANDVLLAQDPPRGLLDLTLEDVQAYLRQSKKPNAVSFKRFVQFLGVSGRIDYDEAEKIRDYLKSADTDARRA